MSSIKQGIKLSILHRYQGSALFHHLIRRFVVPLHFFTFFKELESRLVDEYLDTRPGERICDIGCGCGERGAWINRAGGKACGLDRDRSSVTISFALWGHLGNTLVADAGWLPFRDGVFDKVVCICALEHFPSGEQALKEAWRVLKPGGRLVVSVDSLDYPGLNPAVRERHRLGNGVVHYYTLPELKEKLKALGFSPEKGKYFVNSPLSAFFFNLWVQNRWLSAFLYPLAVPVSRLSDRLWGRQDRGYLAVAQAGKV